MAAVIPPGATSQDELAALLDTAQGHWAGLSRRPLPAVLDTDFIRTGLHYQLSNGVPPQSVRAAQDGALRLFMEYDTLAETGERLPRFADQFGVPVDGLRKILNQDWLPHVDVVKLPASLRKSDPRALAVRERDQEDFPAAALTALLSPCLLLTRNAKHFGPLGVRAYTQAIDGVMAVVAINVGETEMQAALTVPALPVRGAAAGIKAAADRFGPITWVALAAIGAGGIIWYRNQPPERQAKITKVAWQIGAHLLNEYEKASNNVHQARLQLRACAVPAPHQRSTVSAILREMALTAESLSAEQLAELLVHPLRPRTADLRAFLRQHDSTVFRQTRRGGFVLGSRYELPS